ncbi:TPA: hypothetical protein HA238_04265 [Candidatus Micrarchaeota archaeon]|nr:hypothetical protein [Candidatus Micrarchaeota archaeon]
MPFRPDQFSALILLPAQLPKGKEQEDTAKGVVEFRFDSAKLKAIKETLGITDFSVGETRIILERVYEGLKARDVPDKERKISIVY